MKTLILAVTLLLAVTLPAKPVRRPNWVRTYVDMAREREKPRPRQTPARGTQRCIVGRNTGTTFCHSF